MNRRALFALLAGAALTACTPILYETNPISRDMRATLRIASIEVNTTGTAFDSTRARDYTSSLAPELKGQLEREFRDRMTTGTGVQMIVDVSRLNVAGATTTAFGRDLSTLQGSARIVRDGAVIGTYSLQVTAGDASTTTTGALISSAVQSGDGYYRTLLDKFARSAREQIIGADLPGERLLRQITN